MTANINTPVISGYEILEQIYCGSRTKVYRATRKKDSRPVVIKCLVDEYPSFNELLQFRNQYVITENLQIPGIVRSLSLETYGNGYLLIMEDFGGISLQEYAKVLQKKYGSFLDINFLIEFLSIALQLVNILHELNQQRIIHKDIKPANILINPETKQVKLIDFSIASLLPRETQEIKSPNVLEGTLAYISPEQTGRMNRGIDYRSDFYSLGVTFYELLTGKLPFKTDNVMELVHCHIAKKPPSVNSYQLSVNSQFSQVISDIILKLMAKNAEERYQSALGLKHDLEKCLSQLKSTGKIVDFPIAQKDICDRFLIPEKLYGRKNEVEQLLAAFERVSNPPESSKGLGYRGVELMLVAGFSGIGKTAVVNEIHKPIVKQRGYFIKGKYDQFNRNVPFSAFVQAFRHLMGQLLTENDKTIKQWKQKIIQVLGDNAQVIIQVIPELERIIGEQPPAPELSGTAAQNRFNLLFQKFLQVFTTKEHPLVIFLDDLQWADAASLNLMQLLMSEPETNYLLLIGAYRDNEVFPAHPLMLTLENISQAQGIINTITLVPLSETSLNNLVTDTLNCSSEIAQPLTHTIYKKTKGNPFFSTQFLKGLYQENLITFDYNTGFWVCDIAKITIASLTDDVVEFMALQLQKLPPETQDILKLAACIGNQFDLSTLAIVCQKSEAETAIDLWKSLQEGLIIPQNEVYKFYLEVETQNQDLEDSQITNYKFLHDRVQQAAYSLIPETQTLEIHLQIGRLLLSKSSKADYLFAILNHLNISSSLVTSPTERLKLIELNLMGCQRAKSSTAYDSAIQYAEKAMELLQVNSWQTDYDLTLNVYQSTAEVAYLKTNFEKAQELIEHIFHNTNSLIDYIKPYELLVQIYIAEDKQFQAIETGLEALKKLGVSLVESTPWSKNLPQVPDKYSLDIKSEMTNPLYLAALRILIAITPPIHTVKPELFPQVVLTMVNLCDREGYSSLAAYVYGIYGLFLCELIEEPEAAYNSGKISLIILEKFQAREFQTKVNMLFAVFVCACKEIGTNSLPLLKKGIEIGCEVGDIEHVSYSIMAYLSHLFLLGQHLEKVDNLYQIYLPLLKQCEQKHSIEYSQIWLKVCQEFTGISKVDEAETFSIIENLEATQNYQSLFAFNLTKIIYFYSFEKYTQAIYCVSKALDSQDAAFGILLTTAFNFYYSLTLLAIVKCEQEIIESKVAFEKVAENQKKLYQLSKHAPMNYLHKWELVEAERHRVLGNKTDAMEAYDRAIATAKENEYIPEEALGNELAAKFYLDWGKEKVAAGYMQEAYYCYAHWGAKAKTDDLENCYPQLLKPTLQQGQFNLNPLETIDASYSQATLSSTRSDTTVSTSISDALDFSSILKATQAISSSIELDQLVASLTQIILENSGAKKSALILPENQSSENKTWLVKAITTINYQLNSQSKIETILNLQSIDDCEKIPQKIINYVIHTQQKIVIDNCQTNIPGIIGEYIIKHQPKSVLCTPIINKGNLVGILYLENEITAGVFTPQRQKIINLLSSQGAISIENAQLYSNLQKAQLQIVQSEKMSALGNLVAGVAHEMNNPLGFIYATLQQVKPNINDIIKHLLLYQETLPEPGDKIIKHGSEIDLEYTLEDLPNMIDSMVMACDRLENISTSLRTFSRADKDYKVSFNIHDGLDSTILILKHRLKANNKRPAIEVITKYGDFPNVECFPGQLNQVFMNILANAIDALDEFNTNSGRSFEEIKANPNKITIKTSIENNNVKISISDNGKGMSDEIQAKLFDHLFTTKGVGKGTGLGLTIAKQIIEEKHNGKLSCNSILGEGTEFILDIPASSSPSNT